MSANKKAIDASPSFAHCAAVPRTLSSHKCGGHFLDQHGHVVAGQLFRQTEDASSTRIPFFTTCNPFSTGNA
eukprot:3746110-Amphidinium_carterae.2